MQYYEYRIYEVGGTSDITVYGESKPRTIIDQESIICQDKEVFKNQIREMYGDDIKFARSKNMVDGQLYCVVVTKGSAEQFGALNETLTIKCDYCGKEFKKTRRYANYDSNIGYKHWMLKNQEKFNYCSKTCREKHYEELKEEEIIAHDGVDIHKFIDRADYKDNYIYKISKKSTEEFYIGQTNTLPIFRWAQHLRTDRFPIENIEDYQFEILEVVKDQNLLNEIEMSYIKEFTKMYPTLILNKTGVSEYDKKQVNLFENIPSKITKTIHSKKQP